MARARQSNLQQQEYPISICPTLESKHLENIPKFNQKKQENKQQQHQFLRLPFALARCLRSYKNQASRTTVTLESNHLENIRNSNKRNKITNNSTNF